MATSKWTRMNETTQLPSYSEPAGQGHDAQSQNEIIEAIQEEQNRVYNQDLRLLQNLKGSA